MSFVNNEPSLRLEDYPKESADSFDKLFNSITPYFASLTSTVNGRIDFVDNIAAITKDYDLTNVRLPINFQWTYTAAPPMDLRCIKATGGIVPTILIPAWSYDPGTFTISVTQLIEAPGMAAPVAGRRYRFSLRATV